ncbi:MAG: AI-2E family transporter [Flavisolibacter sp.]
MAIVIAILIMMGTIGYLIYFIGWQSIRFSETFPALQQKFNAFINDSAVWFSKKFGMDLDKINAWIAKKEHKGIKHSGALIGSTLLTITNIIEIGLLLPVYIFMILFYKPLLLEFISRLFNKEKHDTIAEILLETKVLIQSYLVGLLIEAIIIAILNSVSLLIIGIEYAFLLGIIGALLNIIPLIGGIISIALPMIIAFATKTPMAALWVLVAYLLVQFIDDHYIVPKIVASKVKINALVSIIVVFFGGALWGIPGMFLSIPLTALIKVIFDRIEHVKAWGFLLGDDMPPEGKVIFKLPFNKNRLPPKKNSNI